MAKIPKPIFACFGINELCQFWLFHRLPILQYTHFAMDSGSFYMPMFAIFSKNVHYYYTFTYQLQSWVLVFHYACQIWQKFRTQFCQFWHNSASYTYWHKQWQLLHSDVCHIWQKFTIFQKWKPKPTMKCNREYYKNTVQVLPYLDMLRKLATS